VTWCAAGGTLVVDAAHRVAAVSSGEGAPIHRAAVSYRPTGDPVERATLQLTSTATEIAMGSYQP
jgi:hypothetical protein